MSYVPRRPGPPSGVPPPQDNDVMQKGSVRAARERLQQAQQAQQTQKIQSNGAGYIDPRSAPSQSQSVRSPPSSIPQPKDRSKGRPKPVTPSAPKTPGSARTPTSPPNNTSSSNPQWPLTGEYVQPYSPPQMYEGSRVPIPTRSPKRPAAPPQQQQPTSNQAPQRPPRPTFAAPEFQQEGSPRGRPPPAMIGETSWHDDDFLSPTSPDYTRPITTSSMGSRASTNSSVGTIPDFPIPNSGNPNQIMNQNFMPPQGRRILNLGPPPSARRGPLSYYSQMSYVSPIAEESSNRGSLASFASSNVIPHNVGNYYDQDGSPSDDDIPFSPGDGRLSRNTDTSETGLVRQASLGKRGKPSLTTIKSSEAMPTTNKFGPKNGGAVTTAALAAGVAGAAFAGGHGSNNRTPTPKDDSIPSGTILFDPSDPSSDGSLKKQISNNTTVTHKSSDGSLRKATSRDYFGDVTSPTLRSRPKSPRSPLSPVDSRVGQILGGLEKGGTLEPGSSQLWSRPNRQGSLADRVGSRRPPRLNVDAVRDAEARGSLTSLPDLIKRATRLAANLDRGKTASRLGMDWLTENEKSSPAKDKEKGDYDRRQSGLSDILASFPPPGVATPSSPNTRWPSQPSSRQALSRRPPAEWRTPDLDASPMKQYQTRRCCGLRLWVFVTLLLILLLLLAAAVVIPIILILLPQQRRGASAQAANNAVSFCQQRMPCENGGSSIITEGNNCGCLCANGFTGATCRIPSDGGCSVTDLANNSSNATVGSAIPRLIRAAQTNYTIPLNATRLLSLFSTTNMSCLSENALVTFSGKTSRRSVPYPEEIKVEGYLDVNRVMSRSITQALDMAESESELEANHLEAREPQASTVNGLVVDGGAPPAPTNGPTPDLKAKPESKYLSFTSTVSFGTANPTAIAASAPPSTATGSPDSEANVSMRDFARVGVLYVFQQSMQLDTAVGAQEKLQNYFDLPNGNPANISLGGGWTIDLGNLKLGAPDGSVLGRGVGAQPSGRR